MSVSGDLKRFLYVSASLNLAEPQNAKFLTHAHSKCKLVAGDKSKVDELLTVIKDHGKLLSAADPIAFLLASLSKSSKDEETCHKSKPPNALDSSSILLKITTT